MRYVGYLLVILVLAAVGFIPALVVTWALERPDIGYISREVADRFVEPGGELIIRIEALNEDRCMTMVQREIIDVRGLSYMQDAEPRLNKKLYKVHVPIPLGINPGPATYIAHLTSICNPWQKIFPAVWEQPPIKFEVSPFKSQNQLPDQQGIYRGLVVPSP